MSEPKPQLYMIAGPKGAGKSTLHQAIMANDPATKDLEFVNADNIQREVLKDPSPVASYKASQLAAERREQLMSEGRSFITESTFSHPSKLELLQQAKDRGYEVGVIHVQVRSADISVDRVSDRVNRGGHPVPEDKTRARFERNQSFIRDAVKMADFAKVYDNSQKYQRPRLLMELEKGQVVSVEPNRPAEQGGAMPAWARELYQEELQNFSPARLNPLAASLDEVRKIATRIGGEKTSLELGGNKQGNHHGKIVGESSLHVLQQTGDTAFVSHVRDRLREEPKMGQSVSIAYSQRGAKGRVSNEPQEQYNEKARAFLSLDRKTAVQMHPDLKKDFQTLDSAYQKMEGQGVSENSRSEVMQKWVSGLNG